MPKTHRDLLNAVLEMLGGPGLVKNTNLGFAIGAFEAKPGKLDEPISDAEFEQKRAEFEREIPAFRHFLLNAPTEMAAFEKQVTTRGLACGGDSAYRKNGYGC